MDLGSLKASIKLNSRNFDQGMNNAIKRMKTFGDTATQINQSLELVSKGFNLMKAGITGTIAPFLQAARVSEGYNTRLKVLLGSQKEGARMFKEMSKFAAKVPFEYEKIMDSATSLSGVMSGGVEEVKQWMPLISDLAAATGLSVEDTTGQIIRMYSAGAASADMFRERGVLAALGFKAGMRYSAEETQKMLWAAYNAQNSKFKSASTELAKTWDGMLSMISDKWFLFRSDVMNTGLFDYLKEQIEKVVNKLNEMQDTGEWDRWVTAMANNFVIGINTMVSAVGGLLKALNYVRASYHSVAGLLNAGNKNGSMALLEQMQKDLKRKESGGFGAMDFFFGTRESREKEVSDLKAKIAGVTAKIKEQTDAIVGHGSAVDDSLAAIKAINAGMEVATLDTYKSPTKKPDSGDSKASSIKLKDADSDKGAIDKVVAGLQAKLDGLNVSVETMGLTDLQKALKQSELSAGMLKDKFKTLTDPKDPNDPITMLISQIQAAEDKLAGLADSERFKDITKELQVQIDQVKFDTDIMGLTELETALKTIAFDTQTMKDSFKGIVDPAELAKIYEMIDKLNELKVAHAEAGDAANKQGDDTSTLSTDFSSAMNAMQGPMSSFLTELATTGDASTESLAQALMKTLEVFAAQKATRLLMEGLEHQILAFVNTTDGIDHQGKAAAAFSGAALMSGFVAGSALAGMAHSGITDVPNEGTWLLDKGERVVDSQTNKDLKGFLKGSGGAPTVNITINEPKDKDSVLDAIPQLQQMIINTVSSNISSNGQINRTIKSYT